MAEILARLDDGYTTTITAGNHAFLADEPQAVGGADEGPNPYELLAAALGACTAMTLRMYANRKEWPLQSVEVRVSHDKVYVRDCEECEGDPNARVDRFRRTISVLGPLEPDQVERLKEIATRCPVHRTLAEGNVTITDEVELILGD